MQVRLSSYPDNPEKQEQFRKDYVEMEFCDLMAKYSAQPQTLRNWACTFGAKRGPGRNGGRPTKIAKEVKTGAQ